MANSDKAQADIRRSDLTYLPPGELGIYLIYYPADQAPSALDASGDAVKLLQDDIKQSASDPKYTYGDIKSHQVGAYSVATVVMKMEGTNINAILYLFFLDRNVVVIAGVSTPGEMAQLAKTIEAMILTLKIKV